LGEATGELDKITRAIEQCCLKYHKWAIAHSVPGIDKEGVKIPTVHSAHQARIGICRNAEWGSIAAAVAIATVMTFVFSSFSEVLKTLIATGICAVIWAVMPGTLFEALDINSYQPESIKKVRQILKLGGLIALTGLLAFVISRSSGAKTGWVVTVYENSPYLIELGLSLCAASFKLFQIYYSYSLDAAREYEELMTEKHRLEAEIVALKIELGL
jgi:hypothetical protein